MIDVYETTGNIYYRLKDLEGNVANYRPITELEGGIGAQAQEYFNIIQQNIQLLRDVIGLNEVTDSFAGQRTYSAAVSAGIEATNNSLYGIIEADQEIMQSLAESISLRIHPHTQTHTHTHTQRATHAHAHTGITRQDKPHTDIALS